jgi:16S rRNA (cytosine1402-N4)-methyltransferase
MDTQSPAGDRNDQPPHLSVLYHPIITALQPQSLKRYVDATVGAGGHSAGILAASAPDGELLGLDVDPQALEIAARRLAPFGERAILKQASYRTLTHQLHRLGWTQVHGILMDLGVSSMQIDTPERGFSFMQEGPLDMRFDSSQSRSAETLVNTLGEKELADILWEYGEEPASRRIARAIVQARPLLTTRALAEVVSRAMRGERGKIHPATRTFQALRIAVNEELQALAETLPQAIAALEPGGRLAVIAFHSLEDRIVKQYFRRESRDCICPPEQIVCTCGHRATLKEITRHPITAGEEEISTNPRARSAKLRVAEKLELA